MKRSLVVSLVVSVLVAVIAFIAVLAAGWSPKLGLDLAGGSEVVYSGPNGKPIPKDAINPTIDIMRNRVDALGVSGANVGSQGGNIVVQLPGLKNPNAVIAAIGQTAQLQFRPVLCTAENYSGPPKSGPLPSTCSATQYEQTAANLDVNTSTQQPGNNVLPDPALTHYRSTGPDENDALKNSVVLLPAAKGSGVNERYLLGPTGVSGSEIHSAQANFVTPNWVVDLTFTGKGGTDWDNLAKQQFHAYIAVDLDAQVVSAPLTLPGQGTFTSFNGQVQISGSFTQAQAQNLALDLKFGSLPVPLDPVNRQTVSPTLGKSSLKAGLAAGIGGLVLVLIYMIFYYRALGIVVVTGLILTAMLLWAIVSTLGQVQNLTLDLAGVTGLIVSVGITVDSYIVYFERLKDEARAGRSIRTSVDKSFRGAFRTVLAADMVTFAAAVVLYLLSVGTVRGFAYFLGLSTLLDVLTTYFFTRPLVILLGRNRAVNEARFIGIARGLAVDQGAPV